VDRIATFQSFIQRSPRDPFPRYGLAMEHKARGDLEASRRAFEELLGAFPDYVPAYLQLGGVLTSLGHRDDAREVMTRGVAAATARGDLHARGELESALAAL
jgi:tetratricopeptide (TPR) repeat protein